MIEVNEVYIGIAGNVFIQTILDKEHVPVDYPYTVVKCDAGEIINLEVIDVFRYLTAEEKTEIVQKYLTRKYDNEVRTPKWLK